ncbi:DUF3021 domain-containing protein [Streptococcus pluranimalium]|uniref:DUF3021 domain-containing protein n=1 Tax=Streptococcus pluranimalium TaxID=82348 RepID=A0A345VMJ1_9STRE|nr:DUF3021 domain-containing protein [Streptococcus pluranimalium]AXJ13943.1 hypothetical protein Sp14A_20580 [Streptococcus pluranimalium]
MKKIVRYFMTGVGFGSFIYLINLLIFNFSPTWFNSIVTWIASGLMGLAALIYEHPVWTDARKTMLHLFAIYALVVGMILINRWIPFELSYLLGVSLQFLLIYLLIFLFFAWMNKDSVSKINQKLRNKENKS